MMNLPLNAVTRDIELQPRAVLDDATWQEYVFLLADGTALPPVVVFSDGEKHWLADGYHRWYAHNVLASTEIAAGVHQGSREQALRFSLGANATHGKRREAGDYARSYATACKYASVRPDDMEAVHNLLGCSMRWAYDLTAPARKKIEDERDAEIAAKKAEGKSNRAIARETGLSHQTVARSVPRWSKIADRKYGPEYTAATGTARPSPIPRNDQPTRRALVGAVRALQQAGEQTWVDALVADRRICDSADMRLAHPPRLWGARPGISTCCACTRSQKG